MGILDQLVDNRGRTATLHQGALDDSLQHSIRGGDHAAPAGHSRGLQGVHPPGGAEVVSEGQPSLCAGPSSQEERLPALRSAYLGSSFPSVIGSETPDLSLVGPI